MKKLMRFTSRALMGPLFVALTLVQAPASVTGAALGVETSAVTSLPAPASVPEALESPTAAAADVVMVEGTVAPERYSALQFTAAGEVAEVHVTVGEAVKAGDTIAALDSSAQALAVAQAQAAVATAKAELALVQAEPRPEDVAAAQADLDAAQARLAQARAARAEATGGVAEAETAAVRAHLEALRAEQRGLVASAQWAEDGGDMARRDDIRDEVRGVEAEIQAAEARLAALPAAQAARLRQADAAVAAAAAQVEIAEANLTAAQAGPMPASIAVADAAVRQAEADLAEAQVALARTTLRAPFDGTITQTFVEMGDMAAPGRPVVMLADLDHLRIETTDLTELDVVHVAEGQTVEVTIDALPGERWTGRVVQIKQQSGNRNGDTVYPAIIELDQAIPALRWGMTASVTFQ